MNLQIKNLIKTPIITTVGSSSIEYVRSLMERKSVHAIPIVAAPHRLDIVGIITSTDMNGITDTDIEVAEYMTKEIYWIEADTDIDVAARIMLEKGVHHLMVKENDKAIGMLSSLDFVKLVATHGNHYTT